MGRRARRDGRVLARRRTVGDRPQPPGRPDVVAPELAGFHDPRHGSFSSGNVLSDSLDEIIACAGQRTWWLTEHLGAAQSCRDGCGYALLCDGPSPAASYFEYGHLRAGITEHCRAMVIARAEAICTPVLALAGVNMSARSHESPPAPDATEQTGR